MISIIVLLHCIGRGESQFVHGLFERSVDAIKSDVFLFCCRPAKLQQAYPKVSSGHLPGLILRCRCSLLQNYSIKVDCMFELDCAVEESVDSKALMVQTRAKKMIAELQAEAAGVSAS